MKRQETGTSPDRQTTKPLPKPQFDGNKAFESELRKRVEAELKSKGRPKRDCWQMYLKSAIVLVSCVTWYVLLVFWAHTWWQGLPLAALLGLSLTAVGFDIMHDGGHNAYSARPWVNTLAATTMDLIGGSSYVWRRKHGLIHHMYVNITGYDTDIDFGMLGRVSPHKKWRPYYRWQHLYLWPLYGVMAIKWHLFDDFRNILTRRIGDHPLPWPKGWDLAIFFGGKTVFLAWVFAIPLLFHPATHVVFYYVLISVMLGLLLSLVFQIPHCGEAAEFPLPQPDTGQIGKPWAVHQAQVTTDFARHEKVATWFLGGLNYHAEHHLFPVICHVNYPAISKVVEETCREFGVRYTAHKTFLAGIASHYRWLRQMGARGSEG